MPLPPPRNSAIRASELSAQGLPDAPAPAPPAPVVPPAPEPLAGKPMDVLDGPWPNLAPAPANPSAEPGRLAAAPPPRVTPPPGDPDGPWEAAPQAPANPNPGPAPAPNAPLPLGPPAPCVAAVAAVAGVVADVVAGVVVAGPGGGLAAGGFWPMARAAATTCAEQVKVNIYIARGWAVNCPYSCLYRHTSGPVGSGTYQGKHHIRLTNRTLIQGFPLHSACSKLLYRDSDKIT